MIFELRTYDLKPGKAPIYLDFFRRAGVALVTRHLPMGGYWMAETGPLNRIEHLWIYEDFAERDACRASLLTEKAWMEDFIPKAFEDVVAQSNRFMEVTQSSPALDRVIAARRSVHDVQDAQVPMFAPNLHGLTFSNNKGASGDLLGQFRTVSGDAPGGFVTLTSGAVEVLTSDTDHATRHALLRPLSLSPLC